jgi:hypothetical protein
MTAEAQRQQRLLACLLADQADAGALPARGPQARALRGLQAYRANADASAGRALAAALPTVQRLIGEDDFAHLARRFWRAQPPRRGDLAEWGEGFADWLAADERPVEPRMSSWMPGRCHGWATPIRRASCWCSPPAWP